MNRHTEVIGWDIGGAHVKASRVLHGQLVDAAQWVCPLWKGEEFLLNLLAQAHARWPHMRSAAHAVTMTGEMVDLFEHREAGVLRIAELLAQGLQAEQPLAFYAGVGAWCRPEGVARHWDDIASANWLATAQHAALALEPASGVLVDIGSTTCDLIAFRNGRVLNAGRTDAQRLATGELVYHGVVRTPLCALGPQVQFRGQALNVMNEFFATTADVYRLTGELPDAHDLHPAADNAGKDAQATRQRLARMIGMDAREASAEEWLTFAQEWRSRQLHELRGQLQRVMADNGLDAQARVVRAGCGGFLVPELVAPLKLAGVTDYATGVATPGSQPDSTAAAAELAAWAQVCAPSVAVAFLYAKGAN